MAERHSQLSLVRSLRLPPERTAQALSEAAQQHRLLLLLSNYWSFLERWQLVDGQDSS